LIVYSTQSYDYLRDQMRELGGYQVGTVERTTFPDGEAYHRLRTGATDRDVVLVGGTISDAETLELYDLACGLVYHGARRLSIVIPYFGYSTMERAVRPGEVVKAKARARLLSSVPPAALGNRVFLLDLHVDAVAHYFEGEMHPVHLYGKGLSRSAAKALGGDDFVLGCTDAGRAKWVESLANDLGVTAAFVYKRRLDGEQTEVVGVSAHVAGKQVVIYDDMIRTGGSLLGAAAAYLDAGATSIAAVCTHGVFPGDALRRLARSGLLTHVVATDSHPRARALASEFLSVQSVAQLFVDRLRGGSGQPSSPKV
jgi:ribose-phosphate pyrophosphokinase